MIIDCISDLHGSFPILQGGDVLIVAGDLTGSDQPLQYELYNTWLQQQPYTHKITIAGNHDGCLERNKTKIRHGTYLHDTGTEIEGIKIYGSPYTPKYHGWNFMRKRGQEIKAHWDLIPNDVDILITHGPAYGALDLNRDNEHCGCEELLEAIRRVKPAYHICGHIHESYGVGLIDDETFVVNCAQMDGNYETYSRPIRIFA